RHNFADGLRSSCTIRAFFHSRFPGKSVRAAGVEGSPNRRDRHGRIRGHQRVLLRRTTRESSGSRFEHSGFFPVCGRYRRSSRIVFRLKILALGESHGKSKYCSQATTKRSTRARQTQADGNVSRFAGALGDVSRGRPSRRLLCTDAGRDRGVFPEASRENLEQKRGRIDSAERAIERVRQRI